MGKNSLWPLHIIYRPLLQVTIILSNVAVYSVFHFKKVKLAVYEMPCKNCPKTYIGETGRLFSTRLAEHKSETDKVKSKSYTRSQRKASTTESFKSALAEHANKTNHVIGWDEAKVIDQEPNKTTRWLKEAIWIRSRENTMNEDEGAYRLDRVYDQVINRQTHVPLSTSFTGSADNI